MKTTILTLTVLLCGSAAGLSAQETARERAQRSLPPDVYAGLVTLAGDASKDGIPEEPLFSKALEGMAKRVPPDRLLPAIRAYSGRLMDARGAFGPTAGTPLLMAGADALQRGVSTDVLHALGSERPRSPMAVLVLADLLESGVPTDRALDVLREAMRHRTREERMLDIPAQVQRLMREGHTARDAADQVRRMLRRGRGGGDMGPPVPPGSEPTSRGRMGGRRRGGGGADR
jgi:hypothetical protein